MVPWVDRSCPPTWDRGSNRGRPGVALETPGVCGKGDVDYLGSETGRNRELHWKFLTTFLTGRFLGPCPTTCVGVNDCPSVSVGSTSRNRLPIRRTRAGL